MVPSKAHSLTHLLTHPRSTQNKTAAYKVVKFINPSIFEPDDKTLEHNHLKTVTQPGLSARMIQLSRQMSYDTFVFSKLCRTV